MDAPGFIDLQELLTYAFGPVLLWFFAIMAGMGFLAGVWVIWLGLLRWMSSNRKPGGGGDEIAH